MKIKIQAKILIVLLIFSLFFVAAISIGVNYTINQRFDSYVKSNFNKRAGQLVEQIKAAYIEAGSFKKIDSSKISLATMGMTIEVSDLKGRRLLTISRHMQSQGMMHNAQMGNMMGTTTNPAESTLPLLINNRKIASVKITSMMEGGGLWSRQDLDFKQRLNSSILLIGLSLSLLAILISFGLAGMFTRPVSRLSSAVSKMGQGDLAARAEVGGSDEIGELSRNFNKMAAKLERQQKERQVMLQDIGHELKTPLAILRNHIEAFQDGVIKPTGKNLQSIHDEILRLARLIDDLNTLALSGTASLKLVKKKTDLTRLANETIEKMDSLLKTKQIKVFLKTAHKKIDIFADPEKVKQILFNLVFNAYKFLEKNGQIQILLSKTNSMAQIEIKDNGIGIPKKELPRIFERFYSSKTRGGTGIGLAVAKNLVEAHDGRIEVQSSQGKGMAFTILLPAE